MHYQYATRDDTPYWRDVSKFKLNNNNALEEFYQSTYSDSMVIPHNVHYNAIAFGQGINTVSNYDVRYENLFAGEDMISRGVEFRKHLLKRQKEWLEHMKKNSI